MPEDLKGIKKINKSHVQAVLSRFARMSKSDLKHHLSSEKCNMLELMVGSVMHQAVKNRDHQRLDFLFNRMIGKVKDEVETTHKFDLPSFEEARQIVANDPALEAPEHVEVEDL